MRLLRRSLLAVGGVVALAAAVLGIEAVYAGTREYLPADSAPPGRGDYGPAGATALRLVMLGDSTAAGVGASSTDATVGGRLAAGLAADRGIRVTLRSVAVSGARAADLDDQVDAALRLAPDVAVLLVGANDATHASRLSAVRSEIQDAVRRLRAGGAEVVVGTSPDLGAARALPQPLRLVAAWQGRRVAAAEAQATRAAGGTPVDLGRLTGPQFRADPETLSSDRYHPSDRGYALWADVLLPAVLAAAR